MPKQRQTASKGARATSKGRSRTPKQTVIFEKDSIIALPGTDYGMNFRLAKLTQDVYDTSKDIIVEYLQRYGEEIFQKLFIVEGVRGTVSADDIIGEADVAVYAKTFKKKEAKKTCYELRANSFLQLKKLASNVTGGKAGAAKEDEDEEDDESEDDEEEDQDDEDDEEEEEEEEEKPRQTKRVVGRKTEAKKDEEEPEQKTAASPARTRGTRGKAAAKGSTDKAEEVSRSTKKQKTAPKKGRATKKEDIEEEDENEEEDGNEEEEEAEPEPEKTKTKGRPKGSGKKAQDKEEIDVEDEEEKPKGKGRAKSAAKGKKKEDEEDDEEAEDGKKGVKKKRSASAKDDKDGKKKKEKKKPTVYKKGKWNPDVELIEVDDTLESKDNQPIDYGSYQHNSRNLIRAVNTKNHKLLENCLAKDFFFSDLYGRWGVDYDFNAIELAFKNNDKKAIQLFCNAYSDPKKSPKLASDPAIGFETFDTGENSKYAYGVQTRRVEMGRGGRELTNAYVKDQGRSGGFDDNTIKRILEVCTDTDLLDILRVDVRAANANNNVYNPLSSIEAMMDQNIESAVLAGNIKVAAYLAKMMSKNQGYGMAILHKEVLIKNDPKKLPGNLKRPSYVAKIYGSNITPIHLACINPNPKILESLLAKAPEYSVTDFRMRKPIHYAAACESPEPLKVLLKHNIDFREGDRDKVTPLMVAARCGRIQNLEALLTTGEKAIITQKNKEGNTAIHIAAQKGHLECVQKLHEHEAKIDAPGKQRMTPLIQAAANGHFDCVQWLVENGAKTTKRDKFKRSSLILAIMNGHLKIASYLLQYGAEFNGPDSSDITPIHYAAAYGFPELIDLLIKAGADQNAADSQRLTPLAVAMLKNNSAAMNKLLSYPNTDVNCKDNQGRTLVMVAVDALSKTSLDHLKSLIVDKGADITMKDLQGNTALHHACQLEIENFVNSDARITNIVEEEEREKKTEEIRKEYEEIQVEVIKLLLDNNASLNEANNDGLTPFLRALEISSFRVCDLLMEHKDLDLTSVNKSDEGIYHILAKIILDEKGLELFKKVAGIVGAKNNLASLVDKTGFTPFLKVVQTFADSAEDILNSYVEDLKEAKLTEKQTKKDEDDKDQLSGQPANNLNPSFGFPGGRGIGKAPRKSTNRPQYRMQLGYGYDHSSSLRTVNLTDEEFEKVADQAEEKFNAFVGKIIAACKELIASGANAGESVQKLKEFRGEKGRASLKSAESLQIKMLADITTASETNRKQREQRRAQQNNQQNQQQNNFNQFGGFGGGFGGVFGGGFGGGYGGHSMFASQKKVKPTVDADKLKPEYCLEGHQNALHLVQNFPHPKFVSFLLELSALGSIDINQQDHLDRTPLHYFIENNGTKIGEKTDSNEVLKLFVEAKANVNLADGAKNTPLFLAITGSNYHFIDLLIKGGANINLLNKEGDSPLLYCVKNNKLQQAEVLLRAGADANLPDSMHRSALHHSLNNSKLASDASFEMEATLLRFGANINALDERGRTPLHYAFISIGNPFDYSPIDPVEVVTSLCSHKACDVKVKDRWGSTALHYAAQRGAQVCVLTLLKKGAEVDVADEDGNTPLALALHAKHADIAIMLIQSKANVNGLIYVKEKKVEDEYKKDATVDKAHGKLKTEGMDLENGKETGEEDEEGMDEEGEGDGDEDGEEGIEDFGEEDDGDNEDFNDEDDDDEHYDDYEEEEEAYNHQPVMASHGRQTNILDLPIGEYSMFTVAIRRDYQGVAYLMLQHGYDLSRAIQDSMRENKMNYVWTLLTKVKDPAILHNTNDKGQNVFHTLAQKGGACNQVLTKKIFTTLIHNKVNFNATDNEGKTPLHHAAASSFRVLMEELINHGADINAQDNEGHTPFTLQLLSAPNSIVSFIDLFIAHKANFQARFKVKTHEDEIEMGPLTYLISKGNRNMDLLKLLINNGLSVNEQDENGDSGLIYAIKQNSTRLVKFILSFPNLDKTTLGSDGKNPIHCVVNPLEFGSFENTEILDLLAPHFDINAVDEKGKPPIYYAYLQDSGVMVEKLKELGAIDKKPAANIKRGATSIVGTLDWSDKEIPYEEDAEKYVAKMAKAQAEDIDVEERVQPDASAGAIAGHTEVLYDDKLGPYDLYMTKVDVEKGPYGGYVFYKMQILHSKLRDVYELLTRYGRIGDPGQVQKTAMSQELAIQEFKKIFKSKTGNEWEEKDSFTRVPGKYRLLSFAKRINHKEYLTQLDLKSNKVPKSEIQEESIIKIMKDITNVEMYHNAVRGFHIDTDVLPLGRLEKSFLYEAQQLLLELKDVLDSIELDAKKKLEDQDPKHTIELKEQTVEKTNKFYELIPNERFKNESMRRIERKNEITQKLIMISDLLDFEISSKIILGALNRNYEVNPLDYCFKALNIKMVGLGPDSPEAVVIKKYIEGSQGPVDDEYILNVFALERKGEAERISQWKHLKNKTLLWHGSKIANFMGIFAQGLRIAPSEAGSSGERGVFFADMFTVSSGYCDYGNGYKMLLLCEVALGDIFETKETEAHVGELQPPYKSVKALGQRGPRKDKKIVMPNGCIVPVGKVVDYYQGKQEERRPMLGESEYIVYDLSQVRIRYLVQTK